MRPVPILPAASTVGALKDELWSARAEQAEALRRAHWLRATGAQSEFKASMRDVDACHARVSELQLRLKRVVAEQLAGSSAGQPFM